MKGLERKVGSDPKKNPRQGYVCQINLVPDPTFQKILMRIRLGGQTKTGPELLFDSASATLIKFNKLR